VTAPTPTGNTTAHVPPTPFPPGAWVGLFARYRYLVGGTTEAPEAFIWGAFAAGLSVLIGRDVTMAWGPSVLVPVLMVCMLAPTARGRKSTALDDVVDMIINPLRPPPQSGEQPKFELVIGSGSGEGFAEALADRWVATIDAAGKKVRELQTGRRALFVIHELGGLLAKDKRGQAGNMIDFLLALFDARPFWTHRTRSKANLGGSLTMTDSTGVVVAATTVEWLVANMTDTHVMAGLANRCIWLFGERTAPIPMRPEIGVPAIAWVQMAVQDVLAKMQGQMLTLEPSAHSFHVARYLEDFYRPVVHETASAATARADQLALRVAMLLAIADASPVITLDHISAAWQVVDYSSQSVGHLVDRLHETNMREAERRVRDAATRVAAARGGTFSKRDVRQRVKGATGMDAELFNRCWDALAEAGDLEVLSKDRWRIAP
jgi:hypothetical protein